jgi:hypothetical protein
MELRDGLLFLLNFHHGRSQAILGSELFYQLRSHGCSVSDKREMREAIAALRNDGELIGSTGGSDGGYWMLEGWGEVNEFRNHEVRSRAMKFLETDAAIVRSATIQFGPEEMTQGQLPLAVPVMEQS